MTAQNPPNEAATSTMLEPIGPRFSISGHATRKPIPPTSCPATCSSPRQERMRTISPPALDQGTRPATRQSWRRTLRERRRAPLLKVRIAPRRSSRRPRRRGSLRTPRRPRVARVRLETAFNRRPSIHVLAHVMASPQAQWTIRPELQDWRERCPHWRGRYPPPRAQEPRTRLHRPSHDR